MGSLKCKTSTRITLSRPCRRPKRALCRRISVNHSCRSYTQAHSVRLIRPSPHLSSQQHLSNKLSNALPAGARLAHGARLDALPAQDQRPSLFSFRPVLFCAALTPHAVRAAAKQRLPQQLKYMGVKSIQLRRMTPRGDRRAPALCSPPCAACCPLCTPSASQTHRQAHLCSRGACGSTAALPVPRARAWQPASPI